MTRDPMRTVTFGVTDDLDALYGIDGDEITTTEVEETETVRTGIYSYESDPSFGSPTAAEGELYVDTETDLFAIVTYHDRPKATQIFRTMEEATSLTISAPTYPQEASAQFYRTFGFNGYTTSFRDDIRTYDLDSSYQYIEPDEQMKEAAMHSNRNPSDDWLDEITNNLIEEGHYVSSMDCMLEENGGSYSFSNPMRITGIPEDEWNTNLLELIFERMRQLYQNNVPTIEEITQ
jgi:hypothetical protein